MRLPRLIGIHTLDTVRYTTRLARCWLLAISLTAIAFAGCSRIVTGGYVDSLDKKYGVYGRCFGSYGPVDFDSASRTLRITIVANDRNETELFTKEYRARGVDVGWEATWDPTNKLTVLICDYVKPGDGHEPKGDGASTKVLLTTQSLGLTTHSGRANVPAQ